MKMLMIHPVLSAEMLSLFWNLKRAIQTGWLSLLRPAELTNESRLGFPGEDVGASLASKFFNGKPVNMQKQISILFSHS